MRVARAAEAVDPMLWREQQALKRHAERQGRFYINPRFRFVVKYFAGLQPLATGVLASAAVHPVADAAYSVIRTMIIHRLKLFAIFQITNIKDHCILYRCPLVEAAADEVSLCVPIDNSGPVFDPRAPQFTQFVAIHNLALRPF